MPEDLRLFITDPPGAASYPITTFSWLLLYAKYGDPAARGALVDFVRFGLTEGQTYAAELGYVPCRLTWSIARWQRSQH
jgi:phosphate transport system substrate-binding protein